MKLYFWVLWLALGLVSSGYAASDEQKMAADILVYINQYRVQHGLPKLVMNRVLSDEALKHSADMATHVVPFGHDGFSQRMDHLHQRIPASLSGAENVAYNYKTAKIVADGWINSPGHRQNLMGHYNLTGIGIAHDKMGRLYYTQMFLRSTDTPVVAGTTVVHQRVQQGYRFFGLLG